MTIQPKQRVTWVDCAKAIAMILVVFGHAIRDGAAFRIVYAFHVTAFFLLSGMTCKADRPLERIKSDFLRIMVPYYAFGLISILIYAVLGKFAANQFAMDVDTGFGQNVLWMLYACPMHSQLKFNMPLWFLPCLFATKLLYYVLHKLCRGKQGALLCSSLLLAALSFVYTRVVGAGLPLNLSVAMKMLVFFALGRAIFQWLPKVKERLPVSYKAILLGSAMLVATGVIAFYAPQVNCATDKFPNIPVFFVTALLGSFGVCLLAMGIDHSKALEAIGKSTLAILVVHKFPLLLFQTVGPQKAILADFDSAGSIVVGVVISIIAIVLCMMVEPVIKRFFPYLLGDFSWFVRRK